MSGYANEKKNREEARKQKEIRITLIQSGHSCLTCAYTKKAFGKIVWCNKKDKPISHYNICEAHKGI